MAGDLDAGPEAGQHEDWLAILEAQGAQFLVLDTERDRDLYQLVRTRAGWTLDLQDEQSALLARSRPAAGAPGLDQMDGARR